MTIKTVRTILLTTIGLIFATSGAYAMEGSSPDFSISNISIGAQPAVEASVSLKQEVKSQPVPSIKKEPAPAVTPKPAQNTPQKAPSRQSTVTPSSKKMVEVAVPEPEVPVVIEMPEKKQEVPVEKTIIEPVKTAIYLPTEEVSVSDMGTVTISQGEDTELRKSAPSADNYGILYLVSSVCILASIVLLLYRHSSSEKA